MPLNDSLKVQNFTSEAMNLELMDPQKFLLRCHFLTFPAHNHLTFKHNFSFHSGVLPF